jgi:thiamine biosynthesis protein ThiS
VRIRINGQWHEPEGTITVQALLQQRQLDPLRVAIELNRRILPRDKYASTALSDNDELEIVTLVGGG